MTVTLLVVPALGAALAGRLLLLRDRRGRRHRHRYGPEPHPVLERPGLVPALGHGRRAGVKEALPLPRHRRGPRRPWPQRFRPEAPPVADRLPFAPRPVHVGRSTLALALVAGRRPGRCSGPTWRLADHQLGHRDDPVPVAGRAHRLRRPDLAGPDDARRRRRLHAGQAGRPSTACPSRSPRSWRALVATAVGLSSRRCPACVSAGVHLAVITLAAAVAIENVVFENPAWSGGLDGASGAAAPLPRPATSARTTPARSTATCPARWFGLFCLVVAIGLALAVVQPAPLATWASACSPSGPTSAAAAAAGVSVAGTKIVGLRPGRLHRRPRRRAVRLPLRLGHAADVFGEHRARSPSWPSPTSAASPASRGRCSAACWSPTGVGVHRPRRVVRRRPRVHAAARRPRPRRDRGAQPRRPRRRASTRGDGCGARGAGLPGAASPCAATTTASRWAASA